MNAKSTLNQVKPIKSITLELSREEAIGLAMIVGSIEGNPSANALAAIGSNAFNAIVDKFTEANDAITKTDEWDEFRPMVYRNMQLRS